MLALKGDFVLECRIRVTQSNGSREDGAAKAGIGVGEGTDFPWRFFPGGVAPWVRVSKREGKVCIQTSKDGKVWDEPMIRPFEVGSRDRIAVLAAAEPGVGLRTTFDRLKITSRAE